MLKQIILALLFLGVAVNAKVTREEIAAAHRDLTEAVQVDNQCVTSMDCVAVPTGSRACGGPNGYVIYAIKSSNAEKIRLLAQKTVQLERQYNLENSVISICSMVMPPSVLCNQANKCVSGSTSSPFVPAPFKWEDLTEKIALVTGGSEGIGFAAAHQFIIEGAEHVFITGRRQQVLDEAVKKLGNNNVTGIQGDVSNMADLDKLYSVIQKEKGRLDIVFANPATGSLIALGAITEKDFDDVFNANVKGVLFTVQKALPLLADGGSIILCGSIAAVKGYPGNSVYGASKAALRSFARTWTVDLKDRKIRVNIIQPGPIDTPALARLGRNEEENKAILDTLKAATVMNRIGSPDELARAVVFLASDDSSYVTGIELFVDGGYAQI
ncbi:unnamed protein product [Rotaria sp. Silwood2]|nr:unnamed protein product [Rotaria sp. Silwood2]CAF4024032.1 unnamed protein product [Rotaria sp. Silwood2]